MRVVLVLLLLVFAGTSEGRYGGAVINTDHTWEYMGSFCFNAHAENTRMVFNITVPAHYENTELNFFFDETDQWESVYDSSRKPLTEEKCNLKNKIAAESKNVLDESDPFNECQLVDVSAPGAPHHYRDLDPTVQWKMCGGVRSFSSYRNRWWYWTISRCVAEGSAPPGVFAAFQYEATNGVTFFKKHYSADEHGIAEMDIAFVIFYLCFCCFAVLLRQRLKKKKYYHPCAQLMIHSIFLNFLYLILDTIHWCLVGDNGRGSPAAQAIGGIFRVASEVLIMLAVLLLGKGWGVVRGRISTQGKWKIFIFTCTYSLMYVALYIAFMFADKAKVKYVYQSAPGYALVALRIAGSVWFSYAVSTTLRNYPEKRPFYSVFYVVYMIWWLSMPVIVLVANTIMKDYNRQKWAHGFILMAQVYTHVTVMWILWPPRRGRSTRFPFPTTANQIGFSNDGPSMTPKPIDTEAVDYSDPNRLRVDQFTSPALGDGQEGRAIDPFAAEESSGETEDDDSEAAPNALEAQD